MPQPPPGDGTAILPRLVAAVESRWPQLVEAVTSLQRGAEAGLQDRAAVAARVRSLVTSGPASAVAHVRRLEAMSHLVWERLNTGHWAEVWPGWRRLYGLLMVARVAAVARLARDRGPGHHEDTVRDLVRMCDLGLLLGGPDILGGVLETLAQDMTEHLSSTGEDLAEASVVAKKARLAAPRPRLSEHSLRLPLPLSEVATASCPSIPEFVASCVAPRRVTRLTGAMEDWPALQLWSPRHLVRLAGPRTVPVELGGRCSNIAALSLCTHNICYLPRYTDHDWTQQLMTVDQFVSEHLTSPQPGARPGYLAQHQLLAQVPALRRDILVPDYCYTGLQVRCRISPHTRCMYLSSPGRGPGDPRLDRAGRHRVPRTHRQEAQRAVPGGGPQVRGRVRRRGERPPLPRPRAHAAQHQPGGPRRARPGAVPRGAAAARAAHRARPRGDALHPAPGLALR